MKQILQNLGTGETILAEVPSPGARLGSLLIGTTKSLVSLGTEKMLIDFGKGNLISKARSQPDKVKEVIQKVRTDGLLTTVDAIKAKLGTPIPLGYCNVGRVQDVMGDSCFAVGDRVVSNGPHAEIVVVPEKLVAKIPDAVSDEVAVFTVVSAIGLQGVRLLQPTLGERIVVSGLGLIGLLTVQILRAHGCKVLGIDYDQQKLALAREFGAETVDLSSGADPVKAASSWSGGVGVDGVLITASTKSDSLIHEAAEMCRQRGRIVLVGVIGLNLQRADFYKKELSFQVSCSYGPGRYDEKYESLGLDYPIGFVRWTEQRNFEAVLELMAEGKLLVDSLISHRFAIDKALDGYAAIDDPAALGVVLEYSGDEITYDSPSLNRSIQVGRPLSKGVGLPVVSFIGAGAFSTRMLLPLLPKGVRKHAIVSSSGVSAAHAANKHGFVMASSDSASVIADPDVDAVFITTPHSSHASLVCESLEAGKHVFVEKPLAMTSEELDSISKSMDENQGQMLMIGFNRRFSPHTVKLKEWMGGTPGAKSVILTVNAGAIPADHWTQNRRVGGGRIIGEGCHFIDLARYLVGQPIIKSTVLAMCGSDGAMGDCVSIQLSFKDGSIGTIHYLANGNKDFPKERIEVFAGGKVFCCENFRKTTEYGSTRKFKTRSQDKGHSDGLKAFVSAITHGGDWPIPAKELIEVSRISIELAENVYKQLAKF